MLDLFYNFMNYTANNWVNEIARNRTFAVRAREAISPIGMHTTTYKGGHGRTANSNMAQIQAIRQCVMNT